MASGWGYDYNICYNLQVIVESRTSSPTADAGLQTQNLHSSFLDI